MLNAYHFCWSFIIRLFLVVSIVVLAACVTPKSKTEDNYLIAPEAITFMTYNVENLFDTEDDVGKLDEAYLPLSQKNEVIKSRCRKQNSQEYRVQECLTSDWSESKLDRKMLHLTDVLQKVREGKGPDVLILQEVENRKVLEIWRKKYLSAFAYKPAILLEGPDERGIDVGILTRLELVGVPKLHVLKFTANENLKASKISSTRGILEVTLRLPDGSPITVLGVHLPSQGNPSEMRFQALQSLQKIRGGLPRDQLVLVGGDFNISSVEESQKNFFKGQLSKNWSVSHLIGCKNCKGTYYYHRDRSWSFFDVLLTSTNMLPTSDGKWKVVPESIRIENTSSYQKNRYGSPARFDALAKEGASDHWPLVLEIAPKSQISR